MYKKLLVILTVVAFALSSCSVVQDRLNVVRGSGNVTSEGRTISGVTQLELDGSAHVEVTFGETESLVVEADDNIIPLIETKVQNGKLVIGSKPGASYSTTQPVKVRVTLKTLEAVSLAGSGTISVPNLEGDTIKLDLSGSGKIHISGTVNRAVMTVGGSGQINAVQLLANSVDVVVDGSGDAVVYASEQMDAAVHGSGSIRYSGNPAKINTDESGSGSISSY